MEVSFLGKILTGDFLFWNFFESQNAKKENILMENIQKGNTLMGNIPKRDYFDGKHLKKEIF